MIEYYIFLGANVLILIGAYVAFGFFAESCKAFHAKITADSKDKSKQRPKR